jgi:staphylococcal nuclease domain-containing protein 1
MKAPVSVIIFLMLKIKAREVHYTMPTDSAGFISEWKGKEIDSIVEQVKDGSTLRVRLLLPDNQGHHVVNLALAGVRSARASGRPGEVAEQWGDEAKAFTETRLLQRSVKTILLSLPSSTGPTPFQQNSSAPAQPTPASIFIGSVIHPAGNVAEHLVAAGLARVVDWHAGMLSATSGAMERLRAAERTAKEKRAALYATAPASSSKPTDGAATGTTSHGARSFEGTVGRIWSADQLSVFDKDGKERRVQLSSIRGPKCV